MVSVSRSELIGRAYGLWFGTSDRWFKVVGGVDVFRGDVCYVYVIMMRFCTFGRLFYVM